MSKFIKCVALAVMVLVLAISNISVSFAYTAPTVWVALDGTGDFNCGTSNAQVKIQEAIDYVAANQGLGFTTVRLKPGTYNIGGTIYMRSGVTLRGDTMDNTVLKLQSGLSWVDDKAMIEEKDTTNSNITIQYLKMDGNKQAYPSLNPGQHHFNLMFIEKCTTLRINNMYLTNNLNDGLLLKDCTDTEYNYNTIDQIGHDGLYAVRCSGVRAIGNKITISTNSGLRAYNTDNIEFCWNTIDSKGSGSNGVEIQKENTTNMTNINIHNNRIFNTPLSGIWAFGYGTFNSNTAKVYIHQNLIIHCGKTGSNPINQGGVGGILVCGFNADIYNNTIDRCVGWGVGTKDVYGSGNPPNNQTFNLNLTYNIITNQLAHFQTNDDNGYGIYNEYYNYGTNGHHYFNMDTNDVYNSANNYEYYNVPSHGTDISEDPGYYYLNTEFLTDNNDYHLKSPYGRYVDGSGWSYNPGEAFSICIDKGRNIVPGDFEPTPNGGKINLGRYGNTVWSSKSAY